MPAFDCEQIAIAALQWYNQQAAYITRSVCSLEWCFQPHMHAWELDSAAITCGVWKLKRSFGHSCQQATCITHKFVPQNGGRLPVSLLRTDSSKVNRQFKVAGSSRACSTSLIPWQHGLKKRLTITTSRDRDGYITASPFLPHTAQILKKCMFLTKSHVLR